MGRSRKQGAGFKHFAPTPETLKAPCLFFTAQGERSRIFPADGKKFTTNELIALVPAPVRKLRLHGERVMVISQDPGDIAPNEPASAMVIHQIPQGESIRGPALVCPAQAV